LRPRGAVVGPFSYLRGPIYLGRRAAILEHSSIKSHVSVGDHAKVGGEVAESIIESYSNKQHHGFLGHSYLGSWVNLGAGTSNSDLKNTYGTIRMDYPYGRVETGMQFLGCVIGDYAKSAINTTIFTGKLVGVCSMMYGAVATNVPSFVNYARSYGQVKEMPVEVAIKIQQRMFQRRHVAHGPADARLMREMFALTRAERNASPLGIEPGLFEL